MLVADACGRLPDTVSPCLPTRVIHERQCVPPREAYHAQIAVPLISAVHTFTGEGSRSREAEIAAVLRSGIEWRPGEVELYLTLGSLLEVQYHVCSHLRTYSAFLSLPSLVCLP